VADSAVSHVLLSLAAWYGERVPAKLAASATMLTRPGVPSRSEQPLPLPVANGSITGALKPGMTEQQVAEVSNNRVPDRVVMTTCGTETPKPFACKVFVYEGAGQYDPKLSVVLEDVGGQWKVSQWL
jgi:hypothetical protein